MGNADNHPRPRAQTGARPAEGPACSATGPTASRGDMQSRARYGILGGTFDPPHIGHLLVAQEAHTRLSLDRVWFVPAGLPPHKPDQPVTIAASRLAMVERAIADDERFAVSTVELERPGLSYTVDTLRALRATWGPSVELFFVLGWDMLLYLPHWHDAPGVLAELDGLVAMHRPGFGGEPQVVAQLQEQIPGVSEKLILVPMPQVELSSSDIRERVARSLPIRYLVPDTVCQYIVQHGLYRAQGEQSALERDLAVQRREETA